MGVEQTLLAGIGSILTVAGSIARVDGGPRALLAKLGWDLPPGVNDIGLASLDLARVGEKLGAWTNLAEDPNSSRKDQALALGELAEAVVRTIADLGDLRLVAPQDYLDRSRIKKEFLTRLLDLYLIQSTALASPALFDAAMLLGWFDLEKHEADPATFQVAHLRHVVHWDRLPMLVTDPDNLLRETYGWGTSNFDADSLVIRLGAVLRHIAVGVSSRDLPAIPLARLNGGVPTAHRPQIQLFLDLPFLNDAVTGNAGISVFGVPPTAAGANDGGFGLAPYADGAAALRIRLSQTLSIGMSAKADLGTGLALVLRPNSDPVLHTGMNESVASTGRAGADLQLDLTLAMPDGETPMTLFSAGPATMTANSVGLALGVLVDDSGTDATVRLRVAGGQLTVTPERLPFLSAALPGDALVVDADFEFSWSKRNGVRLDGQLGLKATKVIGRRIGPVTVDILGVELAAKPDGLVFTATVSTTIAIGPVRLIVDQIGIRSAITPGPGSLGSADLSVRPLPPSGIGVVVDASVVVGGGFLSFDSQKEEYSGILQLEIADKISVKAIGILTTRMPGGAKGYSFVALIFAQGFPPIQLGLGFALTGIGGLLAINRTFDEDVLRGGLKNHMLDSVMFPKDPVRNAPEIISNLNKVFPAATGHHLFGPMLQISWGTPALITANLAVIIEFGSRLRLLILAQIAAILPKRENDLIRLQMDAIGILDFDQGTASLDATLHDSRLLKKFVLTGDMALRLKWKGSPNFALSVGGLHPAFNPPTAFPKLERIAINLSSGDNPRFRCEAYFALTSNSVQFGARAELYVEAAGFSLHGEIGFDVLIQFDPFFFMAGFHAQIQLKRNSTNLFKIRLEGSFSGPRPLHIKGKATFEILWWDVSISIDKTLVEGEKPPPPEPVDVLPLLKEALGNAGNWVSQLPDGQRQVVTLRARTGGPTDVFLHPLGSLTVKQNVVPLNLDISKFGQTTPAGARRFSITSVTVGDPTQTTQTQTQPIKEFFAPAQFLDMTDDEKLSRPSFEQMTAGVGIAANEFTFTTEVTDCLEVNSIEFETWILEKNKEKRPSNPPTNPEAPKTFYKLRGELLERQARFGAAANSELRRTGNAKYRTGRVAHTLSKEGWSIVATENLTVQPVAGIAVGQSTNYSQAAQALRQLKQVDPTKAAGLKILRLSELSKN